MVPGEQHVELRVFCREQVGPADQLSTLAKGTAMTGAMTGGTGSPQFASEQAALCQLPARSLSSAAGHARIATRASKRPVAAYSAMEAPASLHGLAGHTLWAGPGPRPRCALSGASPLLLCACQYQRQGAR